MGIWPTILGGVNSIINNQHFLGIMMKHNDECMMTKGHAGLKQTLSRRRVWEIRGSVKLLLEDSKHFWTSGVGLGYGGNQHPAFPAMT